MENSLHIRILCTFMNRFDCDSEDCNAIIKWLLMHLPPIGTFKAKHNEPKRINLWLLLLSKHKCCEILQTEKNCTGKFCSKSPVYEQQNMDANSLR